MSTNNADNLDALKALISADSLPPVHTWHPDITRDIDMRIARNGDWFYNGSIIARERMVRLFSTVLRMDDDGETYLVTPAEKLRITVDDAPFTAVLLHKEGEGEKQGLVLTTNTGDKVLAGKHHPIVVEYSRPDGEPSPYIVVRDKLRALISRAVFIELAQLAQEAVPRNSQQVKGVDTDAEGSKESSFAVTPEESTIAATSKDSSFAVTPEESPLGLYSDGFFMPLALQ